MLGQHDNMQQEIMRLRMTINRNAHKRRIGRLWADENELFVQQDFSAEGLTFRVVAIEVNA